MRYRTELALLFLGSERSERLCLETHADTSALGRAVASPQPAAQPHAAALSLPPGATGVRIRGVQ